MPDSDQAQYSRHPNGGVNVEMTSVVLDRNEEDASDAYLIAAATNSNGTNNTEAKQEEATMPNAPFYPREWYKTALSVVLAVCSLIGNIVALAIVHDYTQRDAELPDVIFSLIPYQSWAVRSADLSMNVIMISTFVFVCVLHRHRSIVTRRWMTLLALLYTIRIPCLTLTILPTCVHNNSVACAPALNQTDASVVVHRVINYLINIENSSQILCGDIFYSGHTIQLCVGCFMFCRYTPRGCCWDLIRILIRLLTTFGVLCLMISHGHYAIDVLVSYLLVTIVFSLYHAHCETPNTERAHSSARTWLLTPVYFMEQNVPAKTFGNLLTWPCNRPMFMVRFMKHLSGKDNIGPTNQDSWCGGLH